MKPPRVFILSAVKIGGKDRQIALDKYSRLVVLFDPRLIFDLVLRGYSSNYKEICHFQRSKTISQIPAC